MVLIWTLFNFGNTAFLPQNKSDSKLQTHGKPLQVLWNFAVPWERFSCCPGIPSDESFEGTSDRCQWQMILVAAVPGSSSKPRLPRCLVPRLLEWKRETILLRGVFAFSFACLRRIIAPSITSCCQVWSGTQTPPHSTLPLLKSH